MLDLEALAGGEHYALLQKKVHAEVAGKHVFLVIYQSCGSGNRSDVVNFRSCVYPVVQDLAVGI